jgi:hypothetical protein
MGHYHRRLPWRAAAAMKIIAIWLSVLAPPVWVQAQIPLQQLPIIAAPSAVLQALSDPCASSASPTIVAQINPAVSQLETQMVRNNPGSGGGPILDVFNWQPRGRAPAGTELVLTGQGFVGSTVAARVGDTMLVRTSASATQVRFLIPASARQFGQALVVWQQGGAVRTLEPAFTVFDPAVRITRVVPLNFGKSQRVTLCGTSLFYTFQAIPNDANPETKMLRIGDQYIEMSAVEVSPSGDRMSFTANGVAFNKLHGPVVNDVVRYEPFVAQPQPSLVEGPVALTSFHSSIDSSRQHNTDTRSSTASRWSRSIDVRLLDVYGSGLFGFKRPPFLLMDPTVPISRQLVLLGLGLDGAAVSIGGVNLGTVNSQLLGIEAAFVLAAGTSSGQVCAVKNGRQSCASDIMRVASAPVFAQFPPTALAMYVTHTISGLHLLPDPGIAGLVYRLRIVGNAGCNAEVQILEHSDNQIRFKFGESASTPVPQQCRSATLFGGTPGTSNVMVFEATYDGLVAELFRRPYYLQVPN